MNNYLITLSIGNIITEADNATTAYVNAVSDNQHLEDMFITRENLLERGFTKMESTDQDKVWLLIK